MVFRAFKWRDIQCQCKLKSFEAVQFLKSIPVQIVVQPMQPPGYKQGSKKRVQREKD